MKRLFVAAAFIFLVAPRLSAGLTYKLRYALSGPATETISGSVSADGPHLRVDFSSGDGLLFHDGDAAISDDGGKTFAVVEPSAKTYYVLDLDEAGGTAGMLKKFGASAKLAFENPKVDVKDLGDGGVIEGYPTHHYLVTTSFDASLELSGQPVRFNIQTTTESWRTDRLDGGAFLRFASPNIGVEAIDKILATQAAHVKGFPLQELNKVTTSQNGHAFTTEIKTTVTEIKKATIPAATFARAAGLKKIDNPMQKAMARTAGAH